MSDAFYDVAVVGTELPGLMTAAMLAKKGYRVVVLGHASRPNIFQYEGHDFVRRPWLFNGFESSTPIKKVLVELALALEMHNRPKPFNPFYQVVLPDRRINVVANDKLYQREIEREFPGDLVRIQEFFDLVRNQNEKLSPVLESSVILPPAGFLEQRQFKKLTAELNGGIMDPFQPFEPDHPFRAFVLAPLLFGSGCNVAPYSPIQLTRVISHMNNGLFNIDGGIDALKSIFINKVKNNCGDYRQQVTVGKFVMKRGKVKEIIIRDRREAIGCHVVICNMDVKRFFNLIPEEQQIQRFHLRILELQPTHLLYTLNFALNSQAIPEGMGRHVFVVNDLYRPLEDDNLLLMCVDPGGRKEDSPATSVLSVSARLKARGVRPTLESLAEHDERIMAQVRRLIPFFDENLLCKASSWVTYDKRTRNQIVDTSEFVPIFGNPLPETLDASPLTCRTAYKNILVTGDHLHSGLGFEGAFLGTLDAVQLTTTMVTRRTLLS